MTNQDRFKETRSVLYEVHNERVNQFKKWGDQEHSPIEWLAILGEEVGEANKHGLEGHFGYPVSSSLGLDVMDPEDARKWHLAKYRKELIQTAAVAVAMVESLDRGNDRLIK